MARRWGAALAYLVTRAPVTALAVARAVCVLAVVALWPGPLWVVTVYLLAEWVTVSATDGLTLPRARLEVRR